MQFNEWITGQLEYSAPQLHTARVGNLPVGIGIEAAGQHLATCRYSRVEYMHATHRQCSWR